MLSQPVNQSSIVSVQRRQRANSLSATHRMNFAVTLPNQGGSFNPTTCIFILWYHLTTTLPNDQLADIHNVTIQDAYITGSECQSILQDLSNRWPMIMASADGLTKLPRPTAFGWCLCDHGLQCSVDGGLIRNLRGRGTRIGRGLAHKVEEIWGGSYTDLIRCPRPHTDPTHAQQLQTDLDQHQQALVLGDGADGWRSTAQSVTTGIVDFGQYQISNLSSFLHLLGTWLLSNIVPCVQRTITVSTWLLLLEIVTTPVMEELPLPVLTQIRNWLKTWPGLVLGIATTAAVNAAVDNIGRFFTNQNQSWTRYEVEFFRTAIGSVCAIWLLTTNNCVGHLLKIYETANQGYMTDSSERLVPDLLLETLNNSSDRSSMSFDSFDGPVELMSSTVVNIMQNATTPGNYSSVFWTAFANWFGRS